MKTKKKYTSKDVRRVFTEIMANGYHHIKCINNEIQSLDIKGDPKDQPEEIQGQLRALTLTLTLINDLLHPAHKMAKELLNKCEHPIIDFCMVAQKTALDAKLVEPCFCESCTEDKTEKKEDHAG